MRAYPFEEVGELALSVRYRLVCDGNVSDVRSETIGLQPTEHHETLLPQCSFESPPGVVGLPEAGVSHRQNLSPGICHVIRRIQALNFRCLRYVDVDLDGSFHLLVGPNASGKSTLLDVIGFMSDLVSDGLGAAVERRTRNFQDLAWGRPKKNLGFELAVEFDIPDVLRSKLADDHHTGRFRYEVSIQEGADGPGIRCERGLLARRGASPTRHEDLSVLPRSFPSERPVPESILVGVDGSDYRRVLEKSAGGTDTFSVETDQAFDSELSITFGPQRSTLGTLPESPVLFPVATHVRRVLDTGVKKIFLDSRRLREACPPSGRRTGFLPDGSNLPWAVQRLREADPARFEEWIEHVRTALRELEDVRVVEREDDRHAYLMLRYSTGVEVPSWAVSDGTLRLLALTLAAYLPDDGNVYLLEEPENGIHPLAVETVYQSLSSVYDSQVMVATHSPVLLRCAHPKETLCFAKNRGGATDIIAGDRHPRLFGWRDSADMDLLFASEVLG